MGCQSSAGPKAEASERKMVVVNGVTAVGKSTLYNALLARERYSGMFKFSVSHTTRAPRPGEEDGVHYHFVSVGEFEEMIAEGKFLEYTKNHGNYYGTSLEALRDVLDSAHAFLDIDYKGMINLKKASLPEKALYLLIASPSNEAFEQRLRGRGTETEEEIQTRLKTAQEEMAFFKENGNEYDAVVVNDDLARATDELDKVIWGFLSQQ